MNKSMKVNLGRNLQGLISKSGNYRSLYRGTDFTNSKDFILNPDILNDIFQKFQIKEKVSFINASQSLKLLDTSLKIYLKNIIHLKKIRK